MKQLLTHVRNCIFRGLIAIIPLLMCALAIRLLYVLIDKKIIVFLGKFFEIKQTPGLGILLLLICLYLIGLIFSNIVGRQFLKLVERISQRIPFVKTIYGIGKQLTQSFS